MATLKNTKINDTGFLRLPKGTEAQRPANPKVGMMRFNTDTGQIEGYNDSLDEWQPINQLFQKLAATGGDATPTDIIQDGQLFRVHTFTSDSTFEVTAGSGEVEYLIVAGGGGGAGRRGGGGGGGEVTIGTTNLSQGSYSIVVGDGAQDRKGRLLGKSEDGDNGENSSAFGITSLGGGGGGNRNRSGRSGGSGGGGGSNSSGGNSTATTGLGNDGGNSNTSSSGGGGGGAGSPGSPTGLKGGDSNSGGDGGDGISSSISGTPTFYGGGGGGGAYSGSSLPGNGGVGGGGIGQQEDRFNQGVSTEHDGLSNTGGGGGGASGDSSWAAAGIGGSGIVIVRYRIG